MRDWDAAKVAHAAGAELVRAGRATAGGDGGGPFRAAIDSRAVAPGDLFVGIPGRRADGGTFAAQVLETGAWGVLVTPPLARAAAASTSSADGGAVLAAPDPVAALGALARAWRRELGAEVIAVTGSTGKTSTKDILGELLARRRRTVLSRENLNTEIGLPLSVLGAPAGTQVLVLELAMRGAGQIAELTAICEPDVGVIVNVGPVHVELLGSVEGVAAAKAELIAGLAPGATAVLPADEPLLDPYRREDVETVTFGPGGDVSFASADGEHVGIDARGERIALEVPFAQAHQRSNLLAAVAAAQAVGVTPAGRIEPAFSAMRGNRLALPGGVVVIEDCYNANPMSMRAALDDLAATAAHRRVAVLGDMLELGPDAERHHAEIGRHAADRGVELLVAVGPLSGATAAAFGGEAHGVPDAREAAALVPGLVRDGDAVLIKASRSVGLEAVVDALRARSAA